MTEEELKRIEARWNLRVEGIDLQYDEDMRALIAEVRRLHVRLEDKERSLAAATRSARRRQWNDG